MLVAEFERLNRTGVRATVFETQIAAGMVILDEKLPGWRELINPVILNQNSDTDCVLGQIGKAKEWGCIHDVASKLGFRIPLDTERLGFATRHNFWVLTREWQIALATTIAEGQSP